MRSYYQRQGDMLSRIGIFPETHSVAAGIVRATELFAKTRELNAALLAYGGTQSYGRGGYRAGASQRRLLATELRTVLVDMAATARGLEPLRPGISEQFRLGRQTDSHQRLLAIAQAFLLAAEPPEVKKLFTDRAFPLDFDEQLKAQIAALAAAANRKDSGLIGQKEGTEGMRMLSFEITATMRELRPLMVKLLRDTNPTLLPVWNAAARVYAAPKPAPVNESTPVNETSPASAPVAAAASSGKTDAPQAHEASLSAVLEPNGMQLGFADSIAPLGDGEKPREHGDGVNAAKLSQGISGRVEQRG